MSEKDYSGNRLTKAYRRMKADIKKGKWVILGIALFFLVAIQFTYSTCPLLMMTGIPCPFCGMTRAGFSLLKGNLSLAWEIQPMIYGLGLLTGAFIVIRYFTDKELKVLKWPVILFFAVLLIVYVYRMILYFPDQWPMLYYDGNYLRRILGMVSAI